MNKRGELKTVTSGDGWKNGISSLVFRSMLKKATLLKKNLLCWYKGFTQQDAFETSKSEGLFLFLLHEDNMVTLFSACFNPPL